MKSVLVDDTFHLLQVFRDFQVGLVMRTAASLDRERLMQAMSGRSWGRSWDVVGDGT